MIFDEVAALVEGIPYTEPQYGKILYDFILREQPAACLELGFAHGVATCYMAAALDELGRGHITAVDLSIMQDWQEPSVEDLLARTGLAQYVTVRREQTSYTWFLKKMLEQHGPSEAVYDFCFIDGPKNWTVDGLAFLLVDRLLKPGGWVLFDDYSWTYASCNSWARDQFARAGILVDQMDEDERQEPHVQRIFELLVMQHPEYGEFRVQDGNWAWACKTGVGAGTRKLVIEETRSLKAFLFDGVRRVLG